MGIIDKTDGTMSRDRVGWFALGGLGAVVVAVAVYLWWSRPPQMGADEEAFKNVDALYTAVRNQDERRLGECEQRLRADRDAGRLPAAAARHLDSVIGQARSGQWEPAARSLYDFMRAQRRDGYTERAGARK